MCTDGTPRPDQPEHRVFRMRVDTAGQVRYVDDAGVEGAGHLGYDTALAWPLAGTESRLCDRHRNIREGVLAAMQALEDIPMSCSQVDWTHLARIRTLSLETWDANFARHDLLGLTNLTVLQMPSIHGAAYPKDLLAHTPRLQTLWMEGSALEDLPDDLFRYTPLLTHLSLGDDSHPDADLPGDLLVHTPHLESLHLEDKHPPAGLAHVLAHARRLTRLTVAPSTALPETFLAAVPHLTHLTIKEGFEPCETPELLAPVPHLRHFAVHMAAEDGKLACLDRALRLHTPALAELHVELQDLRDLEAEVLPSLPRLTRLTLDVGGLARLPAQLLAEAPELTRLTLRGEPRDAALTLPEGFFAHTPRLTALSLHTNRLQDLPPDLLTPLPGLRQVQLVTEDATALPARFLERVTELRMDTGHSALPWDFLMHAPRLEVLHLTAHSLASLPEGFLGHAPRLETFRLDAGVARFSNLSSFPEGFLTHAPNLVEIRLLVPELEALPPAFLAHAPRLRHLELASLGDVKTFPPGFLSGSPQLRYLNLDASKAKALPADFLTRHPHLETVRLRARNGPALPRGFLSQSPNLVDLKLALPRVEALPEGFLADTPRLWHLEIDVHRVEALPTGFLADVPHLASLNLRALNLTAWPADFLTHAPRIQALGLAMPLLEPLLTPDHRLWDTLQAGGLRVKVTRPEPFHFEDPDFRGPCIPTPLRLGDILEVEGREHDDNGDLLLRVSHWRERGLFANYDWNYTCPHLIDARYTSPTFEVCAANREPEECVPMREQYGDVFADLYG